MFESGWLAIRRWLLMLPLDVDGLWEVHRLKKMMQKTTDKIGIDPPICILMQDPSCQSCPRVVVGAQGETEWDW